MILAPQFGPFRQRYQRKIDDDRREIIKPAAEPVDISGRMLEMLVPQFAGFPACHFRHEHSVQIDHSQRAVLDYNIPVLKIAMRDFRVSKHLDEPDPFAGEMQYYVSSVNYLIQIYVKRWSFDPLHNEDGVSNARYKNAFRFV